MSTNPTPTPRTDVHETPLVYAVAVKAGEVYPNARVVQLRDAQEIEVQRNTLERELAQAKSENAALRKDRERLDWIESHPKVEISLMAISGTIEVKGYDDEGDDFEACDYGLRAAIDAATGGGER